MKSWRTLIRVTDAFLNNVEITIPAWEYRRLKINLSVFPEEMKMFVMPGYRFYADVNLSAEKESELNITNIRKE